MKPINTVVSTAICGFIALGAGGAAQAADAPKNEKCYGISKAGKNDCQTSTSACTGTAKKDAQGDAWIYLPKGTCEKIVGASLQPKK
jgi:uncharacterized membrane protein